MGAKPAVVPPKKDDTTSTSTTEAVKPSAPVSKYAPLTADYPYGPYHFGPTCDADRRTLKDPGMADIMSRGACKVLGGVYDAKYDGADDREIPYTDKQMVRCDGIPLCRNKPGDSDILMGALDRTNPKMIGEIEKENLLLPVEDCKSAGGLIRWGPGSENTYKFQQCRLGLYRKADLPKGGFVAPASVVVYDSNGVNTRQIPGLKRGIYAQSFSLPMKDCKVMGGGWNGGTEGKTDATPVDCHFDWYNKPIN